MGTGRSNCMHPEHTIEGRRTIAQRWGLLLGVIFVLVAPGASHAAPPTADPPAVVYTPSELPPTPFGPPAADIVVYPSNFLPCRGGPIALCYYSGPKPRGSQPDLSCTITDDGEFANCNCVEIAGHQPYFVDINGILDEEIYLETVKTCGKDGADCQGQPNMAPVCDAIRLKQLLPDATPSPDTISTFSYALNSIPEFKIGVTNCLDEKVYAGCMTAPCVRNGETIEICDIWGDVKECSQVPIQECACPTFKGKYQVGQDGAKCDIGGGQPGDNVWSAAFNPLQAKISQFSCNPDAPGDAGCPLLPADPDSDRLEPVIPDKPKDINCRKVCAEYRNSEQDSVEVGFTCDATLCTVSSIKDVELVDDACSGLEDGNLSEILRLEVEVGCSCCASQICGCEPSPETNAKILELNERQRAARHAPQCDLNGSLCGGP